MSLVYHWHTTATEDDIDDLNHVNNIRYIAWMQDAAIAHSTALGWPGERYKEMGVGWVVRTHQIEYLNPAMLDEEIVVETWVADVRRVSSMRHFKFIRESDGTILARAETKWAFVSYATGMPTRIPEEIHETFSEAVTAADESADAE